MGILHRLTIVDQAAETLRQGLLSGRWKTRLPGSLKLAAELGVAKATMKKAIRLLEAEGLLESGGAGESRKISGSVPAISRSKSLRVVVYIASGLENERGSPDGHALELVKMIQISGHNCVILSPSPRSNPGSTGSLRALAKNNPADAWVVYGATLEVYRWFAASGLEVIAIGGRCLGLSMAVSGYSLQNARKEAVDRLIALGHRRIVLLSNELSRRPAGASTSVLFREQLAAAGIVVGEYNTPDWEETPEGFRFLLESLFRFTPPTAIICLADLYMNGLLAFLEKRKLTVPGDVSLVCVRRDRSFEWQSPGLDIAHCIIDHRAGYVRIVRWLDALSEGHPDRDARLTMARLHHGNSIGPAPKG